eukprot:135525-Heterocapsa_arctica.AAC.1
MPAEERSKTTARGSVSRPGSPPGSQACPAEQAVGPRPTTALPGRRPCEPRGLFTELVTPIVALLLPAITAA